MLLIIESCRHFITLLRQEDEASIPQDTLSACRNPEEGVLKNTGMGMKSDDLGALSADATGQLDVLGHDGHTLGVDGAQVRVLEQAHQVRLSSLLECEHGRRLEPQVGLEVLRNLTDQTLEGQLADE
jgi:hypothetical protein